jgi:hypothetical protein
VARGDLVGVENLSLGGGNGGSGSVLSAMIRVGAT